MLIINDLDLYRFIYAFIAVQKDLHHAVFGSNLALSKEPFTIITFNLSCCETMRVSIKKAELLSSAFFISISRGADISRR